MTARSLSLPECFYCSRPVECVVEDDVYASHSCYTVRCRCGAITTQVPHHAVANYGEPYAVDLAWQRWKEMVDKEHMASVPSNEENPGSREETGVLDSDAVWGAVLDAMCVAYHRGRVGGNMIVLKEDMEKLLKRRLDKVIGNPPDDPY